LGRIDNAGMAALRWDIFCRVIDNFGDVGVCWRVARNLAERGDKVRLVIDDATSLRFMAPDGCAGVQLLPWPNAHDTDDAHDAALTLGDVVVEAFGCDPPPAHVAKMAAQTAPPVWVNLEYLSAESYVERSHCLPSPQANGLTKWFFYPGFTDRTGGLLREADLQARRQAFDRQAWLASLGLTLQAHERVASLFCYDNPRLLDLLQDLAQQPTVLLLTPGFAQQQVASVLMHVAPLPTLRTFKLPWLTQTDFDHLLWASDLNFVRGEDSLVRALWSGAPFVWQIYPQEDGAHAHKLQAMLEMLQLPNAVADVWHAWNALRVGAWPRLPALPAWAKHTALLRMRLLAQPDLATQLREFVTQKQQQPS
jgi:uncharacterized repeat protein (TIGR03837 family)